jgi:hypothetical protein
MTSVIHSSNPTSFFLGRRLPPPPLPWIRTTIHFWSWIRTHSCVLNFTPASQFRANSRTPTLVRSQLLDLLAGSKHSPLPLCKSSYVFHTLAPSHSSLRAVPRGLARRRKMAGLKLTFSSELFLELQSLQDCALHTSCLGKVSCHPFVFANVP